jgi:hypothetical protein
MVEITDIVEKIPMPICNYVSGERIRVPEIDAGVCKYEEECPSRHKIGNNTLCGQVYGIKQEELI